MTNLNGQDEAVEFDESAGMLTISIRMRLYRKPGRKVILTPDGEPAWVPQRRHVDNTIVKALARGHRWKRQLESGEYGSAHEVAAAEGITHSFVCRLLRLTLLAPDIVEAILDGTLRRELHLADLLRPFPTNWVEQRALLSPAPSELPRSQRGR